MIKEETVTVKSLEAPKCQSPLYRAINKEHIAIIDKALKSITCREEEMLRLHFGLGTNPISINDIAGLYGLSREYTYTIIRSGIRSLRNPRRRAPLVQVYEEMEFS